MDSFSTEQEKRILTTARESILNAFLHKEFVIPSEWAEEKALMEKRGTFVTLTIQEQLRGCIGSILPVRPLLIDVKENALNAAFHDPRFAPLEKSEASQIHIEVSILSVPKLITFLSVEELFSRVSPTVDGVILQSGYHQATFLPQVWEDLPEPDSFFSQLCKKAGLVRDFYRTNVSDLIVNVYQATIVKEQSF